MNVSRYQSIKKGTYCHFELLPDGRYQRTDCDRVTLTVVQLFDHYTHAPLKHAKRAQKFTTSINGFKIRIKQ